MTKIQYDRTNATDGTVSAFAARLKEGRKEDFCKKNGLTLDYPAKIYNRKNDIKLNYTKVFMIADVSGSTNNSDGDAKSSRSGGRMDLVDEETSEKDNEQDNEQEVVNKTKIIIFSIVEAICTILNYYGSKFNFNNCDFSLTTFSDYAKDEFLNQKFTSYDDLYENLIFVFGDFMCYKEGGTCLASSIQNTLSRIGDNDHALIILATDGQASDKNTVLEFLKQSNKKFDLIVVGAGSISEGVPSSFSIMKNRNPFDSSNKKVENLSDETIRSFSTSNYGRECDIQYLYSLLDAINPSVLNDKNNLSGDRIYIGAFKPPYEHFTAELDKLVNKFENSSKFQKINDGRQYYVDLRDFDHYYMKFVGVEKLGSLDNGVQDLLKKGKMVIINNKFGIYLLVPFIEQEQGGLSQYIPFMKHSCKGGYQLKLKASVNPNWSFVVVDNVPFDIIKADELLLLNKIGKYCQEIVVSEYEKFSLAGEDGGLMFVRPLILK
jgi:hypothetical protein